MKYLTLTELTEHPKNVRARSEYSEASIAGLAASIDALGLLQSLVVQHMEDGSYGVLAGRRRLLALRLLDEQERLDARFKVPCKVIGKDVDHVTAVSLAENAMQEPMAPLDEYEAFAAMTDEGSNAEEIASAFGTTIRAVKERLRYGLIHRDIREAARNGDIPLDTMKAYAAHPCQDTQRRVFEGLSENSHDHHSWRVREILSRQDIRADDPLAGYIIDRYREAGGTVVEGLFDEDTVLTDRELAELVRDEMMLEEAEAIRDRLGLAWAETRPRFDHADLAGYGRIYPKPCELSDEEQARVEEIAKRMDEIAGRLEALQEHDEADVESEDTAEIEALSEEYDALEIEADGLREAYDPEDAARAGVIVAFGWGGPRIEAGLVRPEDALPAEDEKTRGNAPARDDGNSGTVDKPAPMLSAVLREDLAHERGEIVAAALTDDPALAYDAIVFRLATQCLAPGLLVRGGIGVETTVIHGSHSRPEAKLPDAERRMADARDGLDLTFLDASLTEGEKFLAFRELDAGSKARILAFVAASQVEPQLWTGRNATGFAETLYAEAVPEVRDGWRPTAANLWDRISKRAIFDVLSGLGLGEMAAEHASTKKAALAKAMEAFFRSPPETLTDEQQAAIAAWAPEGMRAVVTETDAGDSSEEASGDPAGDDSDAPEAEEDQAA